jgi:hypothetical protein
VRGQRRVLGDLAPQTEREHVGNKAAAQAHVQELALRAQGRGHAVLVDRQATALNDADVGARRRNRVAVAEGGAEEDVDAPGSVELPAVDVRERHLG